MSNKEVAKKVEDFHEFCIGMATGAGDFNYEKYENERNNLIAEEELNGLLPDWLIRCRYGSQFWALMQKKSANYKGRREFLNDEFAEIMNKLEKDITKPASLVMNDLFTDNDTAEIERIWLKVLKRKNADPEGAITASRTLVETTLKYILDDNGVAYTNKDDLPTLYKKVANILNLSPAGHNELLFKQILSGITSIIQGFASLRNNYGDAHGKGKVHYQPEERHVELTVNLSGTVCAYLVKTNAEHKK